MRPLIKALLVLAALALSSAVWSQAPVLVTATVTAASNSAPYASGSYQIQLVDANGNLIPGNGLPVSYSGSLNSSGVLSASINPNSAFSSGSQWKFTICSQTPNLNLPITVQAQKCFSQAVTIANAGDISATLSASAPNIYYFNPVTGALYASNSGGSGTVSDGAGTTTPGMVAQSTGTIHVLTYGPAAALQTCDASTVPVYTQAVCIHTFSSAELSQFDGTDATAVTVITAPGVGKAIWPNWALASAVYLPSTAAGAAANIQPKSGAFSTPPPGLQFVFQNTTSSADPSPYASIGNQGTAWGDLGPANNFDNLPFGIYSDVDETSVGSIATSSIAAGGSLFAVNDTFSVPLCDNPATGHVTGIGGGGSIATYVLDTNGGNCSVVSATPITATSGTGSAATLNILTIALINGTSKVVIPYIVTTVQ